MKPATILITLASIAAVTAICMGLLNKDESDVYCSCMSNKTGNLTVTAHTGCANTKPNSLESIAAGYNAGADIVEFDLRFDKSGSAFLSHDPVISGKKYVTLEEAFALVSTFDSLRVNVDVKQTDFLEQVQPLAEKYGILHRVFFTGVRTKDVAAVREKCPLIPYYLNVDVPPLLSGSELYLRSLTDKIKRCGATGLNVRASSIVRRTVERLHDCGYPVSVWTPTTSEEIDRALTLGADNITTRNPALLCKIIERTKEVTE